MAVRRINVNAEQLFATYDLRTFLSEQFSEDAIARRVDALPQDRFLASSEQQLVEYFSEMLRVSPLVLHEDQKVASEPREVTVLVRGRQDYDDGEVRGVHVKVSIPYAGLSDLWEMAPHDGWNLTTRAEISREPNAPSGWIRFDLEQPVGDDAERLRAQLERHLNPIRETLRAQESAISVAMSRIPDYVRAAVSARRRALAAHEEIKATLNIPFAPRASAPAPTPVPLAKKLVSVPTSVRPTPEWGIADADYEYILKVLRHVGATFERTRRTYAVHDEEELRDILLAHLNGHLEGAAKAEAFSNRGKTDILVEYENRAAFIAECKVWYGEKEFLKAIAQLFSYTTWRDHKTALVIFNKANAGFTELRERIPTILQRHDLVIRQLDAPPGGEWRFEMRSLDDAAARITLHVFLFDVYVKPQGALV
jgi:hypothetical protein